jgi:regulator of cell morphogenesis and NO signaling
MRIGVSLEDRVGNVADTVGNAARVFEILSIDYCCKRDRTLRDAAAAAILDAEELLQLLDSTAAPPPYHPLADAAKTPLHELTRFVATTHHKRARSMLVNLTLLASEAASAHGEKMWDVEDLIATMARDLVPHMRREEQYLFPYIGTLEREMGPDETIVVPLFGTVEYPLQSIRHDHTEDLELLQKLREATGDFTPPKGACDRVKRLFSLAREFHTDLQEHIRLENDVLFPRSIEAERAAANRIR